MYAVNNKFAISLHFALLMTRLLVLWICCSSDTKLLL